MFFHHTSASDMYHLCNTTSHETVTLAQGKVCYKEISTASKDAPVVLLHGLPLATYQHCLIPQLSQNYRIIVPDLAGLGPAFEPGCQNTFSNHLESLVDALKINSVVVFDHSQYHQPHHLKAHVHPQSGCYHPHHLVPNLHQTLDACISKVDVHQTAASIPVLLVRGGISGETIVVKKGLETVLREGELGAGCDACQTGHHWRIPSLYGGVKSLL